MSKLYDVLQAKVEMRMQAYQAVLDKFHEDLRAFPAHAFEWAAGPMKAAAGIRVCQELRNAHKDLTFEQYKSHLERMVTTKARYVGPNSSFPTANLMKVYDCEVWGELLDELPYHFSADM